MIPHNKPTLGKQELSAVARVIRSGWVAQGQEVKKFEEEMCAYLGLDTTHAVAVSSGTAALYLALWGLEGINKRVGIPVYSCSALRNAVKLLNSDAIPLDCAPNSPNIDPEHILEKNLDIAIFAHIFGHPGNIPSNKNIKIIEDCAQALGSHLDGKSVGLLGDAAVFSFYATKLVTSGGQGGMVISKNADLINRIRDYREFDGRHDNKPRFNFQMTDIQAAIGRTQLKRLPEFIKRRKEIYQKYMDTGLEFWNNIFLENHQSKDITLNSFRCLLKYSDPKKLIEKLAQDKIKSIIPIESWELLGDPQLNPNAFKLTQTMVSLPIYPSLNQKHVDNIIESLRRYFDDHPEI